MKRLLLVLLLAALASAVHADPRWWSHDLALTTGPDPKTNPDAAITAGSGSHDRDIVIVYEQPGAGTGQDLWILASFDNGCTWCDPKLWANAPADEVNPRVEAGLTSTATFSVQVVYEREGQVWVSGDASITIRTGPPLCEQLAALAVPRPQPLSRPGPAGDTDHRPRIAKAARVGLLEFHAAWWRQHAPPAGPTVEYANDVSGYGTSWTTAATPPLPVDGDVPDIAADTLASGANASSATIFFREAATGNILEARTADTGLTWSAPVKVSTSPSPVLPAADSSTQAIPADTEVWNAGVWQAGQAPHDIGFDAAHWSAPATMNIDFQTPGDVAASLASAQAPVPGLAPAVSVAPAVAAGSGQCALFAFWTDEGRTPPEIVSRGGKLNAGANPPPPRDLDTFPFTPARTAPPDPAVSLVDLLSNCTWDDGWPGMASGACTLNARGAGSLGASMVASADSLSFNGTERVFFVAVFSDDRTGTPQIYFKRSDQLVAATTMSASPGCEGLRSARIDATYVPVTTCPQTSFSPEWMERYILYDGTASATGPFPNRVVEPASGPSSITLAGLPAGVTHYLWLIGEDQARNIAPPDFDPRSASNTGAIPNQQATVTPPPCVPSVALEGCTYNGSRCFPSDPWLPRDPNPGDTMSVTLRLANTGDYDATGLTGTVVATTAAVVSPAGGDLSMLGLAIAPGGAVDVPVVLHVPTDATCPATIDVSVMNLGSDSGQVSYGSPSCASPIATLDCTSKCPCAVGSLAVIRPLVGIKAGADASFTWTADPNGSEQHLNSVLVKTDIPNAYRPTRGVGTAVWQGATGGPATLPVASPPSLVFLQALSACGADGASEGPM
jgi:hypothetical protein